LYIVPIKGEEKKRKGSSVDVLTEERGF
jgi:hypothetical protein